nr:immunoglobulin light chain junction region [Macaca mulatta]
DYYCLIWHRNTWVF